MLNNFRVLLINIITTILFLLVLSTVDGVAHFFTVTYPYVITMLFPGMYDVCT